MVVPPRPLRARFGDWELDLRSQELRQQSENQTFWLPTQQFRLLQLLLEHAGDVVTREKIQETLWEEPTEADVDHSINVAIGALRQVLKASGETPYIKTLPKVGYRFLLQPEWEHIPEAEPAAPQAAAETTPEPAGSDIDLAKADEGAAAILGAPLQQHEFVEAGEADRRAAKKGVVRKRVLAIAAVVVALMGFGLYYRLHRPKPLTSQDTVVLADITNNTGDPAFDDTLKQGLAFQLEQSPFLQLGSDSKVAHTLKLMGQSPAEHLTPDLGREVCQRISATALITGAIAQLGSQYVLSLKASNCATGDVLAVAQVTADRKETVLKALDAAAVTLRKQLGESLTSVQRYAVPLEETTTPSLDALQAYSRARRERYANGDAASLKFYDLAIALDPNFAMAYQGRGAAYKNLGELERGRADAQKAYTLRSSLSDKERFTIESGYYLIYTGELEKAARSYELWQTTYPRDYIPYNNLGFIYVSLGEIDTAVQEARRAIRLEPNDGGTYSNLGGELQNLNRLDEAEAAYNQALNHNVEGPYLLINLYSVAFLKNDTTTMAACVKRAMGRPGVEESLLAAQADTEAWYGRFRTAGEYSRRAMDSALRNDAKETAAAYQALAALREVEVGYGDQARSDARAAVTLAPNRNVRAMAALALARAGDVAGAEKFVAELDRVFPADTLVQRYWLPTIRAALAMQRHDATQAVELLKDTVPLDLSVPADVTVYLCPAYIRGEAYLMADDGAEAQKEFQKLIDHYGLVGNFPWGSLARLEVARAYRLQGEDAKAKAAYENFLAVWKGADPEIPIYKQAKDEYAALK